MNPTILVVEPFCRTIQSADYSGNYVLHIGLSASYELEFPFYPVREIDFNHVITLKAPDSVGSSRASVSLTVVLDRSGSMRGDKINLLKKSTEFLVTQLKEGDSFGVVSFSSRVSRSL